MNNIEIVTDFIEKYDWVDRKLEEMYQINETQFDERILCPAPLTWVNYRSNAVNECIEPDLNSITDEVKVEVNEINYL